jgi:hypothetical protein
MAAKKKTTGKVEKPELELPEVVTGKKAPDIPEKVKVPEEGMKVKVKGIDHTRGGVWESTFLAGATEVVFEIDGKEITLTEDKVKELL